MFDEPRNLFPRRRRSAPASLPIATAAGFLVTAGIVYWFISRQSQTGIDDRTRQRLMPRRAAS